jgi:hypothetical protein
MGSNNDEDQSLLLNLIVLWLIVKLTTNQYWFHRLHNVVSSNKGIFLIDDDQEAGIASKTDGG